MEMTDKSRSQLRKFEDEGKAMEKYQPKESSPARRRWTPAEEERLRDMLNAGKTALEISQRLKRTIQAIYARLQRIYRGRPRPQS